MLLYRLGRPKFYLIWVKNILMPQFNIKNKGNVMRITNIELLDVNTQSETIYETFTIYK